MKFEDAMQELNNRLSENPSIAQQVRTRQRAPDDAQSMAILQAMMGGSDFGGPRG